MLKEINPICDQHLKYFAQLDYYYIEGVGEIVKKYIEKFPSQGPRAILLKDLYENRVAGCDELILNLYYNFRKSPEYIPTPSMDSSAYIYVNYDNAFKRMHSKNIEDRLIDIIKSPRDANILGLTQQMLTRKKPEKMKEILFSRLKDDITEYDLGLEKETAKDYYPNYSFIVEQLKYNAIVCLKYCNGDDVIELLKEYIAGEHKGFSDTARKSYEYIMKRKSKDSVDVSAKKG